MKLGEWLANNLLLGQSSEITEDVKLPINVGDTVTFQMTSTHNAIEISKESYDTGGIDALENGFQVTYGETKDVTFNEAGVHYYVCQPHVTVGMLGTITVQ